MEFKKLILKSNTIDVYTTIHQYIKQKKYRGIDR